jgi:hypothetical protein
MIIDGNPKFSCQHEYVALPFGFVCHKCEFQRDELPVDGKQSLIFFPIKPQVETVETTVIDEVAPFNHQHFMKVLAMMAKKAASPEKTT